MKSVKEEKVRKMVREGYGKIAKAEKVLRLWLRLKSQRADRL